MRKQAEPEAQAGFTLLEVIIAIVVLSMVMAGLAQGTRLGMRAWEMQTRYTQEAAEMERLNRVLRQLVEQAAPPLAADDKPFAGAEHRVEFITRLPDQPQTGITRRARVALGVDAQNRLLLRWEPHPNAVPVGRPPLPQEIVLAEGIDHLDLRYRGSAEEGGKWQARWEDDMLPTAVQLQIVARSPGRHFPVIVATPMLDTNGSF